MRYTKARFVQLSHRENDVSGGKLRSKSKLRLEIHSFGVEYVLFRRGGIKRAKYLPAIQLPCGYCNQIWHLCSYTK